MANAHDQPEMILASGSPRRRQLLTEAGYRFRVVVPSDEAECGVCSGESPPELVARLAYQKAADVSTRVGSSLIIACDTVAECQGQVLGKPATKSMPGGCSSCSPAARIVSLAGCACGACPRASPTYAWPKPCCAWIRYRPRRFDEYLATGAWEGKAGAFGYQDGLAWVHVERGSETNVVGLPMELLADMLSLEGTA